MTCWKEEGGGRGQGGLYLLAVQVQHQAVPELGLQYRSRLAVKQLLRCSETGDKVDVVIMYM
jgi:hypothetical protein